jgi:hypothetical protein
MQGVFQIKLPIIGNFGRMNKSFASPFALVTKKEVAACQSFSLLVEKCLLRRHFLLSFVPFAYILRLLEEKYGRMAPSKKRCFCFSSCIFLLFVV